MRFLSIDPGSIRTGFAFFELSNSIKLLQSGTIQLSEKLDLPMRLKELAYDLERLIQKHQPEELALERIFFAKNALSSLQLGQARGVILLKAAENGVQVFEYAPAVIKQSVCGTGRATKEQIEQMVRLHLKLPKTFVMTSADHSDALAIGLTHAQGRRIRALAAQKPKRKESEAHDRASDRQNSH